MLGLVGTWYYNLIHIAADGSFSLRVAFANAWTSSLTIDVIVAATTFSIWVMAEGRRIGMRWPYLYIIACWAIALAFAFPLFLALRERRLRAGER